MMMNRTTGERWCDMRWFCELMSFYFAFSCIGALGESAGLVKHSAGERPSKGP